MLYDEAMDKYGSDKPDVRFGLELIDVSDIVKDSGFNVFVNAIKSGGKVKCINAKGCANFSRKDIEGLTALVNIYEAKGLAWMKMADKLESSVVKFFNDKTSINDCIYHHNVTYETSYLNTDTSIQEFFDENNLDMTKYLLKTPIIVKTAKLY